MSDTVLDLPLVRFYLRELDEASLTLPVAQARELREQIEAHLDEALPPGATDVEVQAELTRLGSPGSLAAAAAGPRPAIARRLLNRLGHVPWWAWAAIAILVSAAGTGAGFLVSMRTASPLYVISSGWLYHRREHHDRRVAAGSHRRDHANRRRQHRPGVRADRRPGRPVHVASWVRLLP